MAIVSDPARELEHLLWYVSDMAGRFVKIYKEILTNRIVPSKKRDILSEFERLDTRIQNMEDCKDEQDVVKRLHVDVTELRAKMLIKVPSLPMQHGQLFEITQRMAECTDFNEQLLLIQQFIDILQHWMDTQDFETGMELKEHCAVRERITMFTNSLNAQISPHIQRPLDWEPRDIKDDLEDAQDVLAELHALISVLGAAANA